MEKIFNVLLLSFLIFSFNGFTQEIDSLVFKTDRLLEFGIKRRAFPGAQVLIFKNDTIRLNKTYGFQTYDSLVPIKKHHLYDLASVTKVLASTLAFMKLYELYNIDLDQKVAAYVPSLKRSNKKNSSFREVLSHSGGWQPYIAHQNLVFNKRGRFKTKTISYKQNKKFPVQISDSLFIHKKYSNKIYRRIRKTKLNNLGEYKYSGLWFFLLPEITKQLSGSSFSEFLQTYFYTPLKTERLGFLPSKKYSKSEIVPTENDSIFRKQLIQGWVHDEAAAMMGGISGNAGLFSNASSLKSLLQMLLQNGSYNGKQYLKPETIKKFTQRSYPNSNNRRGLGFDKPSIDPESNYPSLLASSSSYGHSGFTGTFIWVDPTNKCFLIFLSNRVYPSRNQRKLYSLDIRGKLLDYAIQF
ncbi:MAG: serine hydrolase [Flavobacteriaceae bacterium]|jgi:CubicO group peptidase (beta-lactamase class C family)|nr:serine hydrolase [Flavobacteriaceae bacterium]